ncbi:MAG: hypothetical protein JXA82_08440 [Sedimentisphaerales bacterium]|nr:hypothetical protein [Sedimentisphaerales bacterium]
MSKRYIFSVAFPGLLLLSSCAPHLTAEQRRRDIEYLATWAKDYHPCVEVNKTIKGLPSYEAILSDYLKLAEQAQSNEEFFHVVWGYVNLIGASGHGYLLDEESLWSYMLDSLWNRGKGMSDIPWHQFHEASYWARLYDHSFVHAPFRIRHQEGEYFVEEDWGRQNIRIPKGSRILRINGMPCSTYVQYLKEKTWLRHVVGNTNWITKHLLVIREEGGCKGWNVVFRLSDNSEHAVLVPYKQGFPPGNAKEFTDYRKGNCICVELAEDVGYIRIKAMAHYHREGDEKKMRRFLTESGGAYKKLIIDIRQNGGGSTFYVYDTLIRPFLDETAVYKQTTGIKRKFLADTDPAYVERLRGGVSTWAWETKIEETELPKDFDPNEWIFYEITREVKPSQRYAFQGRLYVLIDGGCGSATDTCADTLKRTRLAILVGQPTAGSLGGYLMATTLRLPESGMIFRMEADLDINPDGSFNELVGVQPDVILPACSLPERMDKETLLKDPWIQTILNEM